MEQFPDFDRAWLPYLYLYGVGGLFFVTGLFLVCRSKACDFSRPLHKRWFRVLLFGFAWYAFLHGAQTYVALKF